jgi:hypothetical protein
MVYGYSKHTSLNFSRSGSERSEPTLKSQRETRARTSSERGVGPTTVPRHRSVLRYGVVRKLPVARYSAQIILGLTSIEVLGYRSAGLQYRVTSRDP